MPKSTKFIRITIFLFDKSMQYYLNNNQEFLIKFSREILVLLYLFQFLLCNQYH